MKDQLISETWGYVKHTHNITVEDLQDFDIDELKAILTDCKNN